MGDAECIRRSRSEPEVFGVLFARYFGEVHRYVSRRIGRTVADDLAADVFALAFARRDRYDLDKDCYQEIADALGIPLGTVRSRLNRARRIVNSVLGTPDGIPSTTTNEVIECQN